jgi:hypothetical protein
MSRRVELRLAKHLRVDDIIADKYGTNPDVVVVRPAESYKDIFGRPLLRYWCRREDTGEEGFMSYGPDGIAFVVVSAS